MLEPEKRTLSIEEIEGLKKVYEEASPEEKRSMEIRDLGYPLVQNKETDERNLKEDKGS